MRRAFVIPVVFLFATVAIARAQSGDASLTGRVTDPQKAILVGAKISVVNVGTNVHYEGATNESGDYYVPNLPPGTYQVEVEKTGFKTDIKPGVVLHVQETLEINFEMALGSVSESVTVTAGSADINTTDASVSTVIDRDLVENLPLNGRSFNALLELTPGVVQSPEAYGGFSVNGQRDSTNYYTVDGVSANFGVGNVLVYAAGQGPATTSFGGTNSLLSIDSLQEFRIQTSSVAPEFGRTPGGQVGVTTRSGTNTFHGDLFDYFRNNALDANDWFYDQAAQTAPPGAVLPQPALRQNDFGGVFGGPVITDKLFFFASYEGLRLVEPEVQQLFVPDLATRQSIPAPLNQLANAFPLPNGPDQGNGFAGYTQTQSARQDLDVGALRLDYAPTSRLSFFGRASFAASSSQTPSFNRLSLSDYPTRFVTAGVNSQSSARLSEQFRFNYSVSSDRTIYTLTNTAGAVVPDVALLLPPPYDAADANALFILESNNGANDAAYIVGQNGTNRDRQLNALGDVSFSVNHHVLKFGIDYRNSKIESSPGGSSTTPLYTFLYISSISNLMAGGSHLVLTNSIPYAGFTEANWSSYAQDSWKVGPGLTLTYGLRWDLNPGPVGTAGSSYLVGQNINDPATLSAGPGRQLWTTKYDNFAPRLGVAWTPFGSTRVTLRSGFGVFYDTGTTSAGLAASSPPLIAGGGAFSLTSLPLANPEQYFPTPSLTPPFRNTVILTDPGLSLPYSLQWNVALETSLSREDSLSLTYVGQSGHRLLSKNVLFNPDPNFAGYVEIVENGSMSNYNALQLQYRHHLAHGLQALANYTWSHSLDNASTDINSNQFPVSLLALTKQYGDSDFDVRQNFSTGITYDLPTPSRTKALREIFGGWGIDSIVYARTGFPIDVQEGDPSSAFITLGESRPDVVPGQPFYIFGAACATYYGSTCPGGKGINPAAFTLRPPNQQGDLPRNGVPGFGYTQWDASVRRTFPLNDSLKLTLRLDLFNALNHPNFTNSSPFFSCVSATPPQQCLISGGTSTEMLNQGLAGLSSIYQNGGPRSLQVSLKMLF